MGRCAWVWGGGCGCGQVGVDLGRWVWSGGCGEVVLVWGVKCGCDVGGCGRWVQVMEHVKIEGVEM